MDDSRWSLADEPARVVDLRAAGALTWLRDRYGPASPDVLNEILAQVYKLGAQTVVLEFRYLDADYRDEHSRFYSTTFRRYPSATHRLHFFRAAIPDELMQSDRRAKFGDLDYLGYVVTRPVPGAPVGRVMIAPPDSLGEHITCLVTDEVNLLGEYLSVQGMPFIAQDAQLLRCAHATLWMSGYYQHLRWRGRRLLPSTIADSVPLEAGMGRAIPSAGLTLHQMSAAAANLGTPPLVYELDALPAGETIQRIVCRYLNSGFPVIVAGESHAWVLIGYSRVDEGTPFERIHFVRQDDEVGPYQVVEDFRHDLYSPWQYLIVPLPNKIYLSGEEAEVIGSARLQDAYRRAGTLLDPTKIAYRTSAMLSNDFKAGLEVRGMPEQQTAIYRRMPMSRWIWVVEAVDRDLRRAELPAVMAETVIDATDHARDRHTLAWRVGTTLTTWSPDTEKVRSAAGLPIAPPLPYAGSWSR